MSLQTWEEEYYPTDATDVPVEQAAEHSLRYGLKIQRLSEELGNDLDDEEGTEDDDR